MLYWRIFKAEGEARGSPNVPRRQANTLFTQVQCGKYGQSAIYVSRNESAQVHPIPPFDNLTAFNLMVDKMEELGLWLMYDMRW